MLRATVFLVMTAGVSLAQPVGQKGSGVLFVTPANNGLTTRIFDEAGETPNLIFSPMSLLTGFGMLYEGLGGETRKIFGETMGFPSNDETFRKGFQSSILNGKERSAKYANLVTVEDSASINQDFGQAMVDYFKASPYRHPFSKRPKVAEGSINNWVAERSNDKIKDLLPPGSITSDTKVVLVNVIYFKSDWRKEFSYSDPKPFNVTQKEQVTVDMMLGDMQVGYSGDKGQGYEIVALPFADGEHWMVVVLPDKQSGVNQLLGEKASEILDRVSDPSSLEQLQASVEMPKFKAESRLKVKDLFSETNGINEIFSDRADFSRMAENTKGFKIDEIHHKAVIDVNEKGVEAVGATGLAISTKSFFNPEVQVVMDRPFLYFIVDQDRKTILFAGRLDNPTL